MPYQPKPYDVKFTEATFQAQQMANKGFTQIFFEWTCTVCGERVQIELPIDHANKTVAFYEWLDHTEKADGTRCTNRSIHAPSYKFSVIGIGTLDQAEKVI